MGSGSTSSRPLRYFPRQTPIEGQRLPELQEAGGTSGYRSSVKVLRPPQRLQRGVQCGWVRVRIPTPCSPPSPPSPSPPGWGSKGDAPFPRSRVRSPLLSSSSFTPPPSPHVVAVGTGRCGVRPPGDPVAPPDSALQGPAPSQWRGAARKSSVPLSISAVEVIPERICRSPAGDPRREGAEAFLPPSASSSHSANFAGPGAGAQHLGGQIDDPHSSGGLSSPCQGSPSTRGPEVSLRASPDPVR